MVTKSKVPGFIPQCGFLPRLAVTLQKTQCLRLHYRFKGRGFNVVTAAANAHIECPPLCHMKCISGNFSSSNKTEAEEAERGSLNSRGTQGETGRHEAT